VKGGNLNKRLSKEIVWWASRAWYTSSDVCTILWPQHFFWSA